MKLLLCIINYAVTDGSTVDNKHRLRWPAQGFPGLSAKHMASHLSEVLWLFLCSPHTILRRPVFSSLFMLHTLHFRSRNQTKLFPSPT